MKYLPKTDQVLAEWVLKEQIRQEETLSLIASENYASASVLEASGTLLTNKYAEGYPGKRYYGGCAIVDEIEQLAIERAKALFQVDFANVQPHSGSQANMAVYSALLSPGDTLLGMDLSQGGHLTHGAHVSASGRLYQSVQYGITPEGEIDYEQVKSLALAHRPKLIIAGFSAYSGLIDWAKFRAIADEVGAYLMADIAHVAGLVAAGLYPSPVPYADVITTTTHKTLRGPRGGLILIPKDAEVAKKCAFGVFPATQGGPAMHIILAKAVAFQEALDPSFVSYQKEVMANAQEMASVLQKEGFKIVSGGTHNHLFLIDLIGFEYSGKVYEAQLGKVGIVVNKNSVPGDARPPFETSGLRVGTPALTTRGIKREDVKHLSLAIAKVLHHPFDDAILEETAQWVRSLCLAHPVYPKEN